MKHSEVHVTRAEHDVPNLHHVASNKTTSPLGSSGKGSSRVLGQSLALSSRGSGWFRNAASTDHLNRVEAPATLAWKQPPSPPPSDRLTRLDAGKEKEKGTLTQSLSPGRCVQQHGYHQTISARQRGKLEQSSLKRALPPLS
eukprot:52855-Amphidinium_carterae.1